jgi:putative photosynthetic complex assembly protein
MTLTDRRNLLPLMLCSGLVLGTLALVGTGGPGMVAQRGAEAPAVLRLLRFEDATDGAVVIRDYASGQELARFPVAEGGFVRGTLRALVRERRQERQGQEAPFRLAAWSDGQVTLDDTATGRRVDLTAFGADNAKVFAHLLGVRAKLGD